MLIINVGPKKKEKTNDKKTTHTVALFIKLQNIHFKKMFFHLNNTSL